MAKKKEKKKVTDFQRVLQQNIRDAVGEDPTVPAKKQSIEIDQYVWQRFEALAQKQKANPEKLAEIALDHFTRMENAWFPTKN